MAKQNKKGSTSATHESLIKEIKSSKIVSGTVNTDGFNYINVGKDGIVVKAKEIHFK
jgi:hypothetical protein